MVCVLASKHCVVVCGQRQPAAVYSLVLQLPWEGAIRWVRGMCVS